MSNNLRRLFGKKVTRANRPSPRVRMSVQNLEDRLAPATFNVTTTADAGAGSLRQAILDANASPGADTINAAGVTGTISLLTSLSNISGDTALIGPGPASLTVTRDGAAGNFRIFYTYVQGTVGTITISGLTISNGFTTGGGGGILVRGSDTVTIDNCVISGCTAGQGGGISTTTPRDTTLIILNSTITGNTTTLAANGGGGGILMAAYSNLVVKNSTISGNLAATNGGGIALYGINTMLMENSTISANFANGTGGGGGLFYFGTPNLAGIVLRNSTIDGNTTFGAGGGILVGGGATSVNSITVNNSTITNNQAATGGGGIALPAGQGVGTINLRGTVVADNIDTSAAAADILSGNTVNVNFSLVRDATGFTPTGANNLAAGTDPMLGALGNNGGSVQTRLPNAGSPLINAGTNATLLGLDARGQARSFNQPDIGAVEVSPAGTPSANGAGPDVKANGATTYSFTVTYSGAPTGAGNDDITVTGPGGLNQNAVFDSVAGSVATYHIDIAGGFTPANYGTAAINLNAGTVTVGGTAVPAGIVGRINLYTPATFTVTTLADTGAGSLRDALLQSNSRTFSADVINFTAGLSGTIALASTLFILESTTIDATGATITVSGGGTLRPFACEAAGIADITLTGFTITGGNGFSGAYVPPANFPNEGGAIWTSNERITFDRMVLTGNATTTHGGAIASTWNTALITLRNSTFSGNTTSGTGGVLYMPAGGSLLVENSTFSGNSAGAPGGGALYFFGNSTDGLIIRNSTFTGNTTTADGGAIALNTFAAIPTGVPSVLTIENCTITGNTAGGGGGGIGNTAPGPLASVVIRNSVISGNTSASAPDVMGVASANFSLIGDVTGATITGANNLAPGTNPLFAAAGLANNGGPTQTIALQAASPLVNAGPATVPGVPFDQRGPGFLRVSGASSDIGAFEIQSAVAPTVLSTVVNNSASNQRSRVSSLAVTFNTAVTFAGAVANAFTLTRTGGGAVGGFTATASLNGLGQTVVILDAFTGAETTIGSLNDGNYVLTALASQISAGGTPMAANYVFGAVPTDRLYRFYGDITGDRRVDIADFGFFSAGYLQGPGANVPALDYNQDGRLDITDFGQFSVRFFTSLP